MDLSVYRPGLLVRLADDIDGRVVRVCIEAGGRVTYLVAWWNGRVRQESWVEACEVEPRVESDQARVRVGFVPAG